MDRTRDKNLIIEPNAAMPGRKYSEKKPWSCKYCYWWGGRKKGCIEKQCYYLLALHFRSMAKDFPIVHLSSFHPVLTPIRIQDICMD